ncbi:MAG: PASTA domain-containing protein, partial [Armatimonadetes bacterium]|nr:PASTA domain-containing protein [Armatimonadota bacterium]
GSGVLPWLGLAVVLALVGILFFALRNPNAEPPVAVTPVPSVLGQSEPQALLILQQAGLQGVVLQRLNSDTVPGGQVAEQDPAAGSEPPADQAVKLTISLGPRYVTVPDVKGLSEAEAKKLLPKYGLYASLASAHEPSQPNGVVTAQFPSPGQKVDKGGRVTLYVNRLPDEAPPASDEPPGETPPAEAPPEETPAPPAEQPSEPPAEGNPVDRVIDSAVEAAKEQAAEEIKARAERVKEQTRERIKEEREKLKERAKEVLTPNKGP